jgi:hypothetical protein
LGLYAGAEAAAAKEIPVSQPTRPDGKTLDAEGQRTGRTKVKHKPSKKEL